MPEEKTVRPRNDRMIAALLRERAGLEALGKTDRVGQVDEQLAYYGYEREAVDPRRQPPQGRSATPTQTAAPVSEADELSALRKQAETAGVTVDKRWGVDRLKQEIADAKPKA